MKEFTFIDLFCGIGGIRLGFEQAGGRCVFSSEINKFARQTYEANFGEVPAGDITLYDPAKIPAHDVLCAGFPCQPFSNAGVVKRNSLGRPTGFEDRTQGTLFFNICEILQAKRPKAFFLENVKNLISHDKGQTFQIIIESLKDLGYVVFWKVIDGQDWVPQHRERTYIVGFDMRTYEPGSFDFDLKKPERKPVLRDILEENVPAKYTMSDKLWAYLQEYAERQKQKGNGFGYNIASPDGITRTLLARYYKDGSEILIAQKGSPRRLTPRECARLQGFPDTFEFPVSDSQAYRQLGNSVVVPLVGTIAEKLASVL